jgi:hypothetical protein
MKNYYDAYTIQEFGIPFNECKLEGYTEYTSTEVYSVPGWAARKISRPSLRVVGCYGGKPASGIFTEK